MDFPEDVQDEDQLYLLELKDQAETIGAMTPIEYARLRGMAPQKVYYHIRNKHIETRKCECGRTVVDVATADRFFSPPKEDVPEEEG